MYKRFRTVFDHRNPNSLAAAKRRKRFDLFRWLIADLPRPVRVLDVGGTQKFWEMMGCDDPDTVDVTLLNLVHQPVTKPNFTSRVGDGVRLDQIRDKEYDITFCNSVIEHCGTFERQRAMADEVRRVGKRYYVQAPNWWFIIEPHFVFPAFHWLPVGARVALIKHFSLGWQQRWPNPEERKAIYSVPMTAREFVQSVRLPTSTELCSLFPDGKLWRERVMGFTKSLVICGPKQEIR